MNTIKYNNFGIIGHNDDIFEFHYGKGPGELCRLEAIVLTERGPRRTEIAAVPVYRWRKVSVRAVRELVSGMGDTEHSRKIPKLKIGINRLSTLLGRELAVLLWALMEEGAETQLESILHGWRELAREERWWLFSKASSTGQKTGVGWRRALFYALSEPTDTRSIEKESTKENGPWEYLVGRLTTVPTLTQETKMLSEGKRPDQSSKMEETKKMKKRRIKSNSTQLDLF